MGHAIACCQKSPQNLLAAHIIMLQLLRQISSLLQHLLRALAILGHGITLFAALFHPGLQLFLDLIHIFVEMLNNIVAQTALAF